MRTKEVEEAINILDEYIVGSVSKPILNHIEDLEEKRRITLEQLQDGTYLHRSECINKETLRKINANTDTYRDFAEEVLKLL